MAFLSLANAALLGVAFVLFKIVHQIVYYHFFHPLSKFPGPFWGGVTRLWLTYHNVKGDEPAVVRTLHRKHGMSLLPARPCPGRYQDGLLTPEAQAPWSESRPPCSLSRMPPSCL